MNLKDAYELAFETRDSWREGGGKSTARINANHVIRILGAYLEISEIATHHFKELTMQAQKEGKSKATINRITSSLSTLLNEMKQNGEALPDVKFKRQKEPKGRPGYFKDGEIERLLELAAERDDYMLLHDSILFAQKTGCRRGELLKLTDEHVDFEESMISFLDTKPGRDHYLKMHDDLVPVLERRMAQRIDNRLFPWDYPDQLLNEFKKVMAQAGFTEDHVFHTIRSTTATVLCEKGVPLRAVMGVLNHSNVNTTLRYAKISDKSVAAAIDLL